MRPIDADALIEFCAERWIPLNIDAVNMQPTIEPSTNCSEFPNGSDIISRQQVIDAIEKMNIPEDMCVFEILSHIEVKIATLPTIQPVATDTNVGDKISRQAAIDALDCISGVEEVLRSLPSAQPEYEEVTLEEAVSEIASGSIMSAWSWLNVMIQLKKMGYAICRKR